MRTIWYEKLCKFHIGEITCSNESQHAILCSGSPGYFPSFLYQNIEAIDQTRT